MSEEMIDYRQRLIEAAQIVKDEKVLRRCWKILDRAYDKQPMTQEEYKEVIIPSHQERIIRTIQQLKPINVYRVLVVAETLKSMEQEAAQKKEAQS